MTDPVPPKIRRAPRRAPPLQPDQPWQGQGSDPAAANEPANQDGKTGTPEDEASVKRQKEQSEAALQNVRQGYD